MNFRRRRLSDAAWPSPSAWKQLDEAVGGNLMPVDFPLAALKTDPAGAAARHLADSLRQVACLKPKQSLPTAGFASQTRVLTRTYSGRSKAAEAAALAWSAG